MLESSGLVRSEKIGRVRTCPIDPRMLGQTERWLNEREMEWERRLARLGRYLEEIKDAGIGHGDDE